MGHRGSIARRDVDRRIGTRGWPRLLDLVRRRRHAVGAVQAEDVEHPLVVDRAAEIGQGVARSSAPRRRSSRPRCRPRAGCESARTSQTSPAPTTSPTIEQPPVELGVHGARVQASGRMTSEAAAAGRRRRCRRRPYTPQRMIDITPDPIFLRLARLPDLLVRDRLCRRAGGGLLGDQPRGAVPGARRHPRSEPG